MDPLTSNVSKTKKLAAVTTTTTAAASAQPATQQQQQQLTKPTHNRNYQQPDNRAPKPTSKYVRDFEALFVPINRDNLRDTARSGGLRQCQFRSLCWRYFLHCLPEQYDQWLEQCIMSRMRYERIKAKYSFAKPTAQETESEDSSISASGTTRLSNNSARQQQVNSSQTIRTVVKDEQAYTKAAQNCDHKNLFKTIERDVIRTFPDMEFFRQIEMQSIMQNILFNFASENPQLSYKQGMHELLATLLYVLHTDAQNCLIYHEGGYSNETISTVLNLKYLEHDVYHLFSALMKSIETWYQNDEILNVPKKSTSSNMDRSRFNNIGNNSPHRSSNQKGSDPSRHQVVSVLGAKLKTISENIVRAHDRELYNHLEALQIAPQIYGIRWMRLLFGREYEFIDLLTIWDTIICDAVTMSLVDFIFASMLLTIREELVNGDYTDCLNKLMRHQFKEVQYVIKLALFLRDPKNNRRPRHPSYISSTSNNRLLNHTKMSQTPMSRTQSRQARVGTQQRGSETSLTSKLTLAIIERNESIMRSYRGLMSKVNELKVDHGKTDDTASNKTSSSVSVSGNFSEGRSREVEMTTLSVNYPPGQSSYLMSTPKSKDP